MEPFEDEDDYESNDEKSISNPDLDESSEGSFEEEEDDYDFEPDELDDDKTGGAKKDENDVMENEDINQEEYAIDNEDLNDEDDDEDDETYLQKFNAEIKKNYIVDFHPESVINNYDEISVLSKLVRDSKNNILDDLHKTLPYLTKYEKTRVLGQRASQINSGAKVFVKVPDGVIDGYLIAKMELEQKQIPFIIRRPLPSGVSEYWRLQDLEMIHF